MLKALYQNPAGFGRLQCLLAASVSIDGLPRPPASTSLPAGISLDLGPTLGFVRAPKSQPAHVKRFAPLLWGCLPAGLLVAMLCGCHDTSGEPMETPEESFRGAAATAASIPVVESPDAPVSESTQPDAPDAQADTDQSADVDRPTESSGAGSKPAAVTSGTAQTATLAIKDMLPRAREDEPDANAAAGFAGMYPLQDNPLAGCSLCHVDVEDEFVGTRHFEENVGCKTCHGPSAAHLADENNDIQPDELFARKDVDQLCQECHECGRSDASEVPGYEDNPPLVCIDCHGHHTLVLATAKGP